MFHEDYNIGTEGVSIDLNNFIRSLLAKVHSSIWLISDLQSFQVDVSKPDAAQQFLAIKHASDSAEARFQAEMRYFRPPKDDKTSFYPPSAVGINTVWRPPERHPELVRDRRRQLVFT